MKKLIYIFSIALIAQMSYAQDDLPTGEVEVVKDFDARVADTKRLNVGAKVPKTETKTRSYNYDVSSTQLDVSYEPPTLKPLSMQGEKNPESYKGFLKAGYGVPTSLYGELGYVHSFGKTRKRSASRGRSRGTSSRSSSSRSSVATSNTQVGIHLLHHDAQATDRENQQFSSTGAELFFQTATAQGFAIYGDVGYRLQNRFFYGYDQDSISFTEDEARRRYKTLTASAGIKNSQSNELGIDYKAELSFYNHQDERMDLLSINPNDENGFLIDLGASKYLDGKQKIGIDLQTDYTRYLKDCAICSINPVELTNSQIRPYVNLSFGSVRADLGANIALSQEEFTFFPDIELAAQVAGNRFIAYVGADGGLQKNTFRSITDYNPFVAPALDSLWNSEVRRYYGGLKGQIKQFSYEGQVGYKQVKNLPLYLNDLADQRFFNVLTDDVNIISIGGTVKAQVTSYLSAAISLTQNVYDLEVEEEPWHLPSFEANATLKFVSPDQKIHVTGELFMEDAVPYRSIEGEVLQTNALFDINLGAEYFVTKNIGLFASLNNLAANERQRWNQYPQLGINVMGGVTARF